MAAGINERVWLEWLVKVRIIIITILLAIELAIIRLTTTNVSTLAFVGVMLAWYAVAAVQMFIATRRKSEWQTQSRLQILSDLVFATGVIYTTGGIDTSFNFLFPLIIIVASILLSGTWAYLTAGLAFILLGSTLELCFFDIVPSYAYSRPDLRSLQAVIFINLFAFISVAYLANKLVERMRQADVALKDKSFELENLQVLHEIIVHSISSGLLTTDLDGSIKLANPAAQLLMDREQPQLAGQDVKQFFVDPLPLPNAGRREVRIHIASGAHKLLGVGCSALRGTDGTTIGYIYTFTDLTEIRRLESELHQRDRLAAVGRLAAGIAHEIRNPLSSIAGSVKMLSSASTLTDQQRELFEIVTRESERLNSIVTDFLNYSRDRTFVSRRVDLRRMLDDTLTLLENLGKNVLIARNFSAEEAFTEGDGDKLMQVFWNLCSNALRAMPSGGVLTVGLDMHEGNWRIRFHDTGMGIPATLIGKIFEPFQSGFEGGTGLGLAIVYRIMQAHGAHISVRSERGQGTEFTLLFHPSAIAAESEPAEDSANNLSPRRLGLHNESR